MRLRWVFLLLLTFPLRQAGGVEPAKKPTDLPQPLGLGSRPGPMGTQNPGMGTQCARCHTTQSFVQGRFPHERTGFLLRGAHQKAGCKECHRGSYIAPLLKTCNGCHRDPHAGDLGLRCEGCHDETSWRSRFDVDAHRRTNFPLIGKHAVLPCEECHGEARERRFTRATVDCLGCHAQDYARTSLAQVDHTRMGFGPQCRECHDGWRWSPARFPQHDGCFQISAGPHGAIACKSCHSVVPQVMLGTCLLPTTTCTACHDHACARSDTQHVNVPGYECKDTRCYGCHRLTGP
jgi:hypothetical protein